ncbi:MAG TPA: sulfatase-like hydrolase/transferase [Spirochaetia bacterium]|nr:sulfatase-like hydrolase/transferase [Spirochaetia bacterium]
MTDAAIDTSRPNVLLIATDHLRSDWLGCNGNRLVMTPQIDALAREGITFQGAFSECPVCVPARRILMTGKNQYRVNMLQNVDWQPFPEGPKLAEVMTRSGYQSYAVGKLHTHPQRNRIGFEDVLLNEEGRRQDGIIRDDYEEFLAREGRQGSTWSHGLGNNQYALRMNPLPTQLTTTHWTGQGAMDFLDRRDPTRPFFLYMSFDKPHPPITPSQEFYELYREVSFPPPVMGDWCGSTVPTEIRLKRLRNEWEHIRGNEGFIQQIYRGVAAMITHIDSVIGNVLGHIREMGLLDNTAVIFVSDHGDNLFDHGDFAKEDFFRGSANIPFVVRPPRSLVDGGGAQYGLVNETTPVALQDVMPTILELCGMTPPEDMDGSSLVPFLRDGSAPFREYTLGTCVSSYCINDGRYKYLWFADDDLELMFDVHTDKNDCHDLARDPAHRAEKNELRERLIRALIASGDKNVEDGRLKQRPVNVDEALLRANKGWNNRGRH